MSSRLLVFVSATIFLSLGLAGCVVRFDGEDRGRRDTDRLLEAAEGPGWPPFESAIIRPGTVVLGPADQRGAAVVREQCTAAFIFSDPDNTTLYVGTGAHCFAGAELGDEVLLANGDATGTLVYCSFATAAGTTECPPPQEAEDQFNDFALVQVSERHRPLVHPAVLLLGGPTGIGDRPARGDAVFLYGNSAQRDESRGEDPEEDDLRSGHIFRTREETLFMALERPTVRGDSGSPVIDGEGNAVGILQFGGQFERCPGDEQDLQGATDLFHALTYLREETGLEVVLHTWPLLRALEAPPMREDRCA